MNAPTAVQNVLGKRQAVAPKKKGKSKYRKMAEAMRLNRPSKNAGVVD